jgi:hypothetical protein
VLVESIDKSLKPRELEEMIRQGAKRIFEDDDSTTIVTKAMVDKLVDREHYLEQQQAERKKAGNETDENDNHSSSWLSAFKVGFYTEDAFCRPFLTFYSCFVLGIPRRCQY